MTASAVYEGRLAHRRFGARPHTFSYPTLLAYLDLDDLESTLERLPAAGGWWAPVRFERTDYLSNPPLPLAEDLRRLVEARTGRRPDGPVRLLTQLRTFGWLFNPISIYWCFDPDGVRVRTLVLEVSNTPWGERHHYVLEVDPDEPPAATFDKALHVSPFMAMEQTYRLATTRPSDRLTVRLESHQDDELVFAATLALTRRPFTADTWLRALAHHPFPTHRVSMGIHTQAARLWRKGVPVVPHREVRRPTSPELRRPTVG